jgi:hypothetical protein
MAEVEAYLEEEREFAVNSPMPTAESAEGGVYCEAGCHDIRPKYAPPKSGVSKSAPSRKSQEGALHFK